MDEIEVEEAITALIPRSNKIDVLDHAICLPAQTQDAKDVDAPLIISNAAMMNEAFPVPCTTVPSSMHNCCPPTVM